MMEATNQFLELDGTNTEWNWCKEGGAAMQQQPSHLEATTPPSEAIK